MAQEFSPTEIFKRATAATLRAIAAKIIFEATVDEIAARP